MGGINVKNTMVEVLMQNIAPHPCFGCGKIGTVLCDNCKYNIISEPFVGCILCGRPNLEGICNLHTNSFEKVYVVGRRSDVLQALIDALKFSRVKSAAYSAALLLHESLPILPVNTVVVPVPTVASHIRQRGYDQAALIAYHFAKLRSLEVLPLVLRANKATQHRLNRQNRIQEAQNAFVLNNHLGQYPETPKLIIDDIITTGSTVSEVAKLLNSNGSRVWIGALAYQPLD